MNISVRGARLGFSNEATQLPMVSRPCGFHFGCDTYLQYGSPLRLTSGNSPIGNDCSQQECPMNSFTKTDEYLIDQG